MPPAGGIAVGLFIALSFALPAALAVGVGGLVGVAVAAIELYFGLAILGRAFDKFDVTAR